MPRDGSARARGYSWPVLLRLRCVPCRGAEPVGGGRVEVVGGANVSREIVKVERFLYFLVVGIDADGSN